MKAIILTACQSGIASTAIASGLLESAAKAKNWNVVVECQSTVFQGHTATESEIQAAELIIVASNTQIDLSRFVGKLVYQVDLSQAIQQAEQVLAEAESKATILTQEALSAMQTNLPTAVTQQTDSKQNYKIVAVTACPTGVAHTFMAAEALQQKAAELGFDIKVETRGSVGAQNALTESEIAQADFVIIAADIELPLDRFAGKRLYKTSTSLALKKTEQEIKQAIEHATVYQAQAGSQSSGHSSSQEKAGPYKHLMTGVSFMLPMVVAGGLIIALSFVFGIEAFKEPGTLAAALMKIGGESAFALMIPILAGYIAFSIADRPGLAPGLVGGMLASSLGAGFLGGIIAGFIAGYIARWLAENVPLPKSMTALKPILIIPFLATLATGLLMIYVVGSPIAKVMEAMTNFLQNMGTDKAVILGIVLGAMMCFDLGGPVNKAAYAFGTGLLTTQTYEPMAAIMAAGMVPALGMGVATFIAKQKFEASEREAGKASFVLGLCFISEGAIPFAAKDPLKVIPSCMLGGAVTGAISMYFGAKLMAPHGGLFVLLIPNAISPLLPYLLAITVGTLVTGFVYATLKVRPKLVMA